MQEYNNGTGNSDLKDTFLQISPLNLLRSGYYAYDSGALDTRTSRGRYWSGRYYSIVNSRYLYFASTYLYPQNGGNRSLGIPLRCLAR